MIEEILDMAVTITWHIERLEKLSTFMGKENIITAVDWKISALNDGSDGTIHYIANISGTIQLFMTPEVDFTNYNDLTEAQVLSWVKAAMGSGKIAEYENQVYKLVILRSYRSSDVPLIKDTNFPWAT